MSAARAVLFDLPSNRLWFRSGTNHAGEIRGTFSTGWQVGVSVNELNAEAIEELGRQADDDEAGEPRLFVDSGAFSEVRFGPAGCEVVAAIGEADWAERLAIYDELAWQWGSRCYLVAPDRVGSQAETLERLRRWSGELFGLAERGANIIVVLQRGDLRMGEFAVECVRALGWAGHNHEHLVWGIPCKKAATTPLELAVLARDLAQVDHRWRFHLLGVCPTARDDLDSPFWSYLGAIRRVLPDADVSCDSVRIRALVGKTNGKGGRPRALTAARAEVLASGVTGVAEVKAASVQVVYGRENAPAAGLVSRMNEAWLSAVAAGHLSGEPEIHEAPAEPQLVLPLWEGA